MTVPACTGCNRGYAREDALAAAIVATVSFTEYDRRATAIGGWLHSAMKRDRTLGEFIGDRLGEDGIFRPDFTVMATLTRIATKTALGLMFFEFGRIVPRERFKVITIEHAKNVLPEALLEGHRVIGSGWAEVTKSGRELERQVMAGQGLQPRHVTRWKTYVPGFFEYNFIRRSNDTLLCGIKLHNTLTILLECPWPSEAGSRRRGKPTRASRTAGKKT